MISSRRSLRGQVGASSPSITVTFLTETMSDLYTKFDSLNSEQIREFVDAYAERIIDDMDVKCLMQFVFDTITENLIIQGPNEILEEVFCVYDEEVVEELIDSVS